MAGTVSEIPQKLNEKIGNKPEKVKDGAPKLNAPPQTVLDSDPNDKIKTMAAADLMGITHTVNGLV